MVLFEGDWELKRALMCLFGAKRYTIFRSAPICALRGERVNPCSVYVVIIYIFRF